jgi:hypothetical protein
VIATKRQQIVQIRREVKALQTITEKAALKRDIKQGTGQDRSPDEAYAVVDEINRKLDKMVAELARPRGMTSPPYSIETNADSLEQHANDANWVKVPSNLLLDRSYLKNAETTYKVSATQATTMVNVLAISKRGLRSHELKDPGVIARLATAQKKITDVQKDLKTYLGHLNRAKKAMAKLESKFKAEAKKKK